MKILLIILMTLLVVTDIKQNNVIIVNTGEVKLATGKIESKDFAYCSAVICRFGDSAIYAHALPEHLDKTALSYIWENKIYSNGQVFSATAIQRILNITDSLNVNRKRLSFYIIAGCEDEGLNQILPSVIHYNLKTIMVKLDNTFKNSHILRNIIFDSKTGILQIEK